MFQAVDERHFTYTQSFCNPRGPWADCDAEVLVHVIGRFRSKGGFRNRNLESVPIPHVVQSGHGWVEVDGQRDEVGPGDLFVLWPGQTVLYWDAPDEPWRYMWFRMSGSRMLEALSMVGLTPDQAVYRGDFSSLIPVLEEADSLIGPGKSPPLTTIITAWRLLHAVQSILVPETRELPSMVERARIYLDHQFSRPCSIDGLAQDLDVSRVTLFRHFREAYGCSPKQYLMRKRLDRAKLLLRQRQCSIQEIAQTCGFPNAHYFARVFGQEVHMTPTQWRRQADLEAVG